MKNEKGLSVAIGTFDGLHCGHEAVINNAVMQKINNASAAVIEIENKSAEMILTKSEKREKIYDMEVDEIITLDLDEIKDLSAEQFVRDILRDRLNVKYISVGFNFTFGRNASGDSNTLKRIGEKCGMQVDIVPPVKIKGNTVSSTKIKELIKRGKIKEANNMLGYDFYIVSEIVRGDGRGEKLGYRTLNQIPETEKILPRFGVYSSRIFVKNEWRNGITNVGVHPTVAQTLPQYETHMLDHDDELYGEMVKTELIDFIRPEKKFETLKELSEQLQMDVSLQRQKNTLQSK